VVRVFSGLQFRSVVSVVSVKSVVKPSCFPFSLFPFAYFAYFAVKTIRVHPAPSMVKNSGTIGVPADGSRTSRGRVSDGFNPHDRSAKCGGGRVDGSRGSSIPHPLPRRWASAALFHATGALTSTPRSTIRSKPESSGVSYKIHSGSLRITPGRLTPIRSEPDSTGAIRSKPEFHRQIQILCRARLSSPTLYSRLLSPSVANSCE
jgi:hypothetical protein